MSNAPLRAVDPLRNDLVNSLKRAVRTELKRHFELSTVVQVLGSRLIRIDTADNSAIHLVFKHKATGKERIFKIVVSELRNK